MKKISISILGLLVFCITNGQKIDRTKQPESGPAPVITFGNPEVFKLANGMTVLVVEDHHLPKVTASFFIDQGPITEGAKAGLFGLMGQMLNEGTTTKSKAEFDEAVEQMGASVSLSGGGASTSALTRFFPKAFNLMVEGLRHPAFKQESLDKLKSQSLTALKAQEKSAKAISERVVNALVYGTDHPSGEFETEKSISSINLDEIKKAYHDYVTPSRSYLTFVGDIKPSEAKSLAMKALNDWKGVSLQLPKLQDVKNPSKTEIDFVDVSNAVQAEITVVNVVDLPMSNPDYFATRIANQILGGGAEGYLYKNLREAHGYTYGSFSSIGSGRYQSTFSAFASVRNEKVDSAIIEMLNEIERIRTKPVSEDDLNTFKALYNGAFALSLENPGRTASFASTIMVNKLPKDFYKTYMQKINAVTAADVERIAKKYFNYSDTRVVVVGRGSELKSKLEALGYPVHYYDAYAKEVKQSDTAAISNVSAADVIKKYIDAIGGADKLKSVNTMYVKGNMQVQGMTLPYISKAKSPNIAMMAVLMNDNPVFKRVFNGTSGFSSQMGNKQDFTEDEMNDAKDKKSIFEQLEYNDGTYKTAVTGVEKVNGKDAIKLVVTGPSGTNWNEFYDPETGYLVKSEKKTVSDGQSVLQSVVFSDYRKTADIMVPHKLDISAGDQQFEVIVDSVQFNEGVTDADFN